MTAQPYTVKVVAEAKATWDGLKLTDERKWKRVNKAIQTLAQNPRHPSLQAHKFDVLKGTGPNGEDLWEAYIENRTPSAWRFFFYYDSKVRRQVVVVWIGAHL